MASYRGHLALAAAAGAAYGSVAAWQFQMDWGPVFLGAALTAVGGFLPDLDSDSGVPVRELFGLAAATMPFLLFERLRILGFSLEQALVLLAGLYVLIRYGVSELFKTLTVHRGMFHSIPAMLIAGMAVFVAYHSPDVGIRLYLAGGVVLGFLSHLLLDELCSVDFNGVQIELNKSAGSAFKFFSNSWAASLATYSVLFGFGYVIYLEVQGESPDVRQLSQRLLRGLPW